MATVSMFEKKVRTIRDVSRKHQIDAIDDSTDRIAIPS